MDTVIEAFRPMSYYLQHYLDDLHMHKTYILSSDFVSLRRFLQNLDFEIKMHTSCFFSSRHALEYLREQGLSDGHACSENHPGYDRYGTVTVLDMLT